MSSLKIKPEKVSLETEKMQLDKNIRVNKSILCNIKNHMGGIDDDNLIVLGVDIIGTI